MGCLRPCGIQSGQQPSVKDIIEYGLKIEKINKKVVKAKKFLKELMLKKNHEIFDIIIATWISPEIVKKFINDQEEKEREEARKREAALLEESMKNKSAQVPKKKKC